MFCFCFVLFFANRHVYVIKGWLIDGGITFRRIFLCKRNLNMVFIDCRLDGRSCKDEIYRMGLGTGYCEGNLNFATASEDDEAYTKKKVSRVSLIFFHLTNLVGIFHNVFISNVVDLNFLLQILSPLPRSNYSYRSELVLIIIWYKFSTKWEFNGWECKFSIFVLLWTDDVHYSMLK